MNTTLESNNLKLENDTILHLSADHIESSTLFTQDFSDELRILVDESNQYSKNYKYEYYDKLYKDALIRKALDIPIDDSISEWREITDINLKFQDERLFIKNFIIDACKVARKYGESLLVPVLINKTSKKIETIPLNIPIDKVLLQYSNLEILKLIIIEKFVLTNY